MDSRIIYVNAKQTIKLSQSVAEASLGEPYDIDFEFQWEDLTIYLMEAHSYLVDESCKLMASQCSDS